MCGLCKTVHEKGGVEKIDGDMLTQYTKHVEEKKLVRQKKGISERKGHFDKGLGRCHL